MRLLLLPLLAALAACDNVSHADDLPPDPEVATADVVLSLALLSEFEGEQMEETWLAAHARFERDVEPALRHGCGKRPTAAVEFAFGRLRHVLTHGGDRGAAIADVRQRLETAQGCLVSSAE